MNRVVEEDLGLGLRPGDSQYRAYVGPPEDYDLIAAMTFNLLTVLGLRQHHSLLDVGCGSLRVGRLLIPYLNRGKYVGIEPNEWLVQAGFEHELGDSIRSLKSPAFCFTGNPEVLREYALRFDFVSAQSIFSHCGADLIQLWLKWIAQALASTGALIATFCPGDKDESRSGWIYPECVHFQYKSMEKFALEAGLRFESLDWRHPRQEWALFAREDFDFAWSQNAPLTWNRRLETILKRGAANL